MGVLTIERIGGFAGYGGAGSRLKADGKLDYAKLAPADQRAVDVLFTATAKERKSWENPQLRDGFRYQITRVGGAKPETVEVPEDKVPAALAAVVKDRID